MKKILAFLLTGIMLITVFAACSEQQKVDESSSKKDKNSSVSSKQDDPIEEPTESTDPEDEMGDQTDDPLVDDFEDDYSDIGYDEPEEEDNRSEIEKRMENVLSGLDEELNKDSIYYKGSLVKLANVIRRAEKGKKTNILFYGGSNTSNNGTETVDTTYPTLVSEWWNAEFTAGCNLYVKGMSALTSINACMRVKHDVTSLNPDIVVLDFAVEDAINNMAKTNAVGYDNLIRRIIQECPNAAIIGLMLPGAEQTSYTSNIKNCRSFVTAAKYQKEICKYYDIPIIDADTAIWDVMFDLIKVTTKTEIPLMTWAELSQSNVALNSDAHLVLAGMFNYLFDQVHSNLKTIGTKAPATPTVGYQGEDTYMKGTMISMDAMVEGKIKGYSCDLYTYDKKTGKVVDLLSKYGYSYSKEKSDTNGMTPYLRAYQHFIAPEDANNDVKILETNPYYVSFTIPEVKKTQSASFMIVTSYRPDTRLPTALSDYGPVTIECYDATGKKLNSPTAVAKGAYSQAFTMKKCQAFAIPEGTVKMTFKVYTFDGAYLVGFGYFEE